MVRNSVKNLRMSERLTNAALADEIRVTPSYITRIENNEKQPSIEVMFRIVKHFKCKVEDVFQYIPSGGKR